MSLRQERSHYLCKEVVFREEYRTLQFFIYVGKTDGGLTVEIHRNDQYCQLLYVDGELAGTGINRAVELEVFDFELSQNTFITPLLKYLKVWDLQPFLQSS